MKVQIIGLPRSGTRWLAMLINNNYDAVALKTGKHDLPGGYPFKPVDLVLAIRKRFDHWMGSILRTPVNMPETHPEIYYDGELNPLDAVKLHARFYREWRENGHAPVVEIAYEDLLRHTRECLTDVAKAVEFGRTTTEFNNNGPDRLPEWRRTMYLEG